MKRSLFSAVAVLAAATAGCGSSDDVTNPPAPPPPPPPPAFAYQVVDLGTPSDANATPGAIDGNGRIHLFVQQPDGRHLFRWDNGALTDLGLLPGVDQQSASAGGRVAGVLRTAACATLCDTKRAVYLWDMGTVTELDFGAPTGDVAIKTLLDNIVLAQVDNRAVLWQNGARSDVGVNLSAAAGNMLGQVVGTSFASGTARAFSYENGVVRDLGALSGGATSEAVGINDAGDIVGTAAAADGTPRAVIWPRGGLMQEINVTADSSYALAVNANGAVLVGLTRGRRWVWNGSSAMPVGHPAVRLVARVLNDRGEVAGSFFPNGNDEEHAFVWRDGIVHDLGTGPAGVAAGVTGSNANGDLIGYFMTAGGIMRSVMWQRQ